MPLVIIARHVPPDFWFRELWSGYPTPWIPYPVDTLPLGYPNPDTIPHGYPTLGYLTLPGGNMGPETPPRRNINQRYSTAWMSPGYLTPGYLTSPQGTWDQRYPTTLRRNIDTRYTLPPSPPFCEQIDRHL